MPQLICSTDINEGMSLSPVWNKERLQLQVGRTGVPVKQWPAGTKGSRNMQAKSRDKESETYDP